MHQFGAEYGWPRDFVESPTLGALKRMLLDSIANCPPDADRGHFATERRLPIVVTDCQFRVWMARSLG
jgi:hypothetical protein